MLIEVGNSRWQTLLNGFMCHFENISETNHHYTIVQVS
jgi:hypothetical protein